MKKTIQYILTTLISLGVLSFFMSSCSDDEKINEWDMNYIFITPIDHLKPIPSYTLEHYSGEGVVGSVEFQFVAKLQKTAEKDVKVNLETECEGISAENIVLTSQSAIIKAGSKISDTITITINNWSDIEDIADKFETELKINLANFESPSSDIAPSTSYTSIILNITKNIRRIDNKVSTGTPSEGTLQTNVKDWIFTFMNGVENANSNSVAGTGSSDVATNGVPFWLIVDFKEEKTLTGVQTQHWASGYAPRKVEVFVSENNRDWVPFKQGSVSTSGSRQYLKFEKPVKTRYLKYEMITVPSRVDITKFYVYSLE